MPSVAWSEQPSVIPLVPAANWRLQDSQALELGTIRKWGGDPVVEREYGVKAAELRTYRLNEKATQALLEEAPDTSAAYGLLTYYSTETMTPEKGMELTVSGPAGAFMVRGRFFVRVIRPAAPGAELSDNDFRALLIFVGGTGRRSEGPGSLPIPMPAQGLVPGSEKYLLGLEAARRVLPGFRTDLIGFSQGAECQVASYLRANGRVSVIAINYPTPQIARVRFGAMERFLDLNQDRGKTSLYGRRQGSYVFLVSDAESPAAANSLMDEFKVTASISWDRPYPGDKPFALQVVELFLANVALTLILVGGAIVGGILIFLSRKIAAKWFPQSAWGHPDEGSIIRLNLS